MRKISMTLEKVANYTITKLLSNYMKVTVIGCSALVLSTFFPSYFPIVAGLVSGFFVGPIVIQLVDKKLNSKDDYKVKDNNKQLDSFPTKKKISQKVHLKKTELNIS